MIPWDSSDLKECVCFQVVFFLREIVESFPVLQDSVVDRLMSNFSLIASSRV